MKVLKPRYDLLFLFLPTCLAIAALAYFFYFNLLLVIPHINWVFNFLVLILLFLPLYRPSPLPSPAGGRGSEKREGLKWLGWIFAIQLLCNFLMWAINNLIYYQTNKTIPSPLNLIHFSLINGLFPLGFMMLVTATLGYFTYIKNSTGTLASTYAGLFKNNDKDAIGIIVNTYMRLLIYFVIVLCAGMMVISFLHLFQILFGYHFVYGLKLNVILICCGLLWLSSNQYVLKQLQHLAHWKIPIWVILISFSFVLSISYVILNYLVNFLAVLNPNLNSYLLNISINLFGNITVIITFVWLALATIAGAIIAAISRGYHLPKIFIVNLVANAISWLVIYGIQIAVNDLGIIPLIVLLLISLTSVMWFLLRKQNITQVMRATLPSTGIKPRSTFSFIHILPLVITSFVTTYITAGIHFLSLISVAFILPCFVMIIMSFLALLKDRMFYDSRTSFKP